MADQSEQAIWMDSYVVPLGDDLAVGGEGLGPLVHIDNVVERHLESDVDHVVGVGSGQHVVPSRVVSQQVHRELKRRNRNN